MKNILLIILLIFTFQMANAQFHFLEKNEGVEKIQLVEITGKKTAPKENLKHTKFFNPDGTLQKLDFSWASYEYYYEDNVVIEILNRKEEKCASAKEYHLSWEGNTLTIKEKDHTGEYSPKNKCEIYGVERIAHGLASDHLFKDIERRMEVESGVKKLTKIKYKDDKNREEYELHVYTKNRRNNYFKLYSIKKYQRNNENSFLEQRFAVTSYGRNEINMTWQGIKDQFGFQAKYLNEKEFYENSGEDYMKYEFQFDDNDNWVKRTLINDSPDDDKINEKSRNIFYY